MDSFGVTILIHFYDKKLSDYISLGFLNFN